MHVYNKHNRHKNTTLTHKKTLQKLYHLENQVVVVVVAAVMVAVVVVAAVVVAVVVVHWGQALGF